MGPAWTQGHGGRNPVRGGGFPSPAGKLCPGVSPDLLRWPGWQQGHWAARGGHHAVGGRGLLEGSVYGQNTLDQGRPGWKADTCLSGPSTRRLRAWKASSSEPGEGDPGQEADSGHRDPAESLKVSAIVASMLSCNSAPRSACTHLHICTHAHTCTHARHRRQHENSRPGRRCVGGLVRSLPQPLNKRR